MTLGRKFSSRGADAWHGCSKRAFWGTQNTGVIMCIQVFSTHTDKRLNLVNRDLYIQIGITYT